MLNNQDAINKIMHLDYTQSAKLYIGKDIDNQKVYVEIELKHKQGKFTTTDHKTVTNPVILSIIGHAWLKSGKDWAYGGQIYDQLTRKNIKNYALPKYQVDKLVVIWKNWHLNDMQGACIHQDDGAHVEPDSNQWLQGEAWSTMQTEQTAKCPEGYKYGSAWLLKTLPYSVIADVQSIMKGNN